LQPNIAQFFYLPAFAFPKSAAICSLNFLLTVPADLHQVIDAAWEAPVPGYLLENEARFLGVLATLTPAQGAIVEIGSYRGRSAVMLAKIAAHYGLGPVVAVDPHNSPILVNPDGSNDKSSYQDLWHAIRHAGIEDT
jgi:hypothetical protein